jgi:amino acid transporter
MQRAIGLRGALAVNVITMVGIGPLITIPLVLSSLNGPLALIGWIAGAVVALCDGLVWAELGSRYPGSGGTYVYVREIFGAQRWGRLFAFLFNWQFLLYAPCLLASGYIGFADYAAFAFPQIGASVWIARAVAVGVGLVTIAALYRRTARVAALGVGLCVCAIATLGLVIGAALPHADLHRAFTLAAPVRFDWGFLAGFGSALFVTLYDYVGYSDAALIGDEVREPRRTIPLAIVLSVILVAVLYLLLQVGVLGAIPWQTLVGRNGAAPPPEAQFVASTVVAMAWGHWPALVVTALVLVTAFASVYGNLLGFSRIPYAAARDGAFLPIFARLHPTKDFPHVAVLVIGGLSLIASLFTLDQVIALCTAGIVLVQSVLQIVALGLLRARGERAPFRMPLYPLPAIVALVGWLLAFWYTGPFAIWLGVGWLVAGVLAYLIAGRLARWWPFAVLVACAVFVPVHASASPVSQWATWRTSAILLQNDTPVLSVDGKPFFVNGAAFFYERIPHDRWFASLQAYRSMGINTIDLYLIWNWHEHADGTFDFSGATNDRRDLRGLLAMIHQVGFKIIVRPGPVIRNEWRNGGYPDWLLERSDYAMPLHDVLEGRYPATATLQNARADAAAAEWMNNATHRTYAARWLHAALNAVEPWSHDVIAIALDDDQGAYIDNDTWPAPHWHRYIDWLRATVQSTAGPHVPLFINTYQMKVTASAPVWAWGNWYQSDAYAIGDHDLAQLMFSTALLQTQPNLPVMSSEFQAGWLQGADQVAPRAADPSNTTLALHELLQLGVHGIVNFPVQDTIDPAGWEAPWANRSYAWDAALTDDLAPSPRYWPTRAFGELTALGPYLATLQPKADAAIAWLPSAYDAALLDNHRIATIAAATIAVQQRCRTLALTCRFVDLRLAATAQLLRSRILIVPRTGIPLRFVASVERTLAAIGARVRIVHDADAARALVARPSNGGIVDSALLLAPDGASGILDAINPATITRTVAATSLRIGDRTVAIPAFAIAPRSARDIIVAMPLRSLDRTFAPGDRIELSTCRFLTFQFEGAPHTLQIDPRAVDGDGCILRTSVGGRVSSQRITSGPKPALHLLVVSPREVRAYDCCLNYALPSALAPPTFPAPIALGASEASVVDFFADGDAAIVLSNHFVRAVISPGAGARSFVFEDVATQRNAFTTIGALRDDVASPQPPSARDYIAAYTHPFPAGTFNRTYACAIVERSPVAQVRCDYDAHDLANVPIHFEKTFALGADTRTLVVTLHASADAASISTVAADTRVDVGCPSAPGVICRIDTRAGYRLVRLTYPAGLEARLTFTLQGAAP